MSVPIQKTENAFLATASLFWYVGMGITAITGAVAGFAAASFWYAGNETARRMLVPFRSKRPDYLQPVPDEQMGRYIPSTRPPPHLKVIKGEKGNQKGSSNRNSSSGRNFGHRGTTPVPDELPEKIDPSPPRK